MITIAIDGYSSTGKSSISRQIAQEYGFLHVDTGAFYRALTYAYLEYCPAQKIDEDLAAKLLGEAALSVGFDAGQLVILLNGNPVGAEIRDPRVSNFVSEIAAQPAIRKYVNDILRSIEGPHGIVMDGRDIGTVVLPNATLKFFLTASAEERARRRFLELQAAGKEVSLEETLDNIQHRDYIDSHRAVDPLMIAPDAIVIDNTQMTKEQTIEALKSYIDVKV